MRFEKRNCVSYNLFSTYFVVVVVHLLFWMLSCACRLSSLWRNAVNEDFSYAIDEFDVVLLEKIYTCYIVTLDTGLVFCEQRVRNSSKTKWTDSVQRSSIVSADINENMFFFPKTDFQCAPIGCQSGVLHSIQWPLLSLARLTHTHIHSHTWRRKKNRVNWSA